MKAKLFNIIGAALLAVGGMSAFAFAIANTNTKTHNENKATYSETVSEYYSGINWNNTEATLKTALFNKIKITSAGWSYDGLWEAYKTTDVRSNGTVWDIYSDTTQYHFGKPDQGANYSKEGDSYNREHVIPQGSFKEAAPMKSDAHHVLPSDGYVNNRRSSYPHGKVASATYTSNDGCKLGSSAMSGYTGTVFEPMDNYKGDIARIYFYFVTCYQDKLSSNTFDGFDRTTYPSIKSSLLPTYLQWAKEDPVSQKEIDRNNLIYATQGNRNPFIDSPYAIGAIWDSAHASDYGTKGEYTTEEEPFVGVSISNSSLSITKDSTAKIHASSSDSSTITWSTSDSNVASISSTSAASGAEITITGEAAGTATITAKATIDSTNYTKTCTVTVTEQGGGGGGADGEYSILPSDLDSSYPSNEKAYITADGLKIKAKNAANYSNKVQFRSDGSYIYNTEALSLSTITLGTTGGSGTITIYGGNSTNPTSTTITASGGVYNLSGYSYFKIYNGSSNAVTSTGITITASSGSEDPKTLESIVTAGQTEEFVLNDTFVYDGICTAYYSDGSESAVTPEIDYSEVDMSAVGTYTVYLEYSDEYGSAETSYEVTISSALTPEPVSGSTYTANGDYVRITSTDDLENGDYLIVYETGNLAFNGGLNTLDAANNTISVTINSGRIASSATTDAAAFTYNSSDKTLKSKSGYYIGRESNSNGLDTSASTKYKNTITFSGNNATITSSGDCLLRYNSATDQKRFRYYKTGQQAVQLYKKTIAWGSAFLSNITCDGGTTPPDTVKWSSMKTIYNNMETVDKNAVASSGGSTSGTVLQQAIARYVFIVNKYQNRDDYPDYLNKASGSNVINHEIKGTEMTTLLVVIAASSIILGLSFLIFKKKTK